MFKTVLEFFLILREVGQINKLHEVWKFLRLNLEMKTMPDVGLNLNALFTLI